MKVLKVAVNLILRASILYFMVEILLNPQDPRFDGKGQSLGGMIMILVMTLLFPAFQFLRHKWQHYPFWYDSLYLTVFWLDFAGNSFNLYDAVRYFDKIPHFVSPGVLAIVLRGAFGHTRIGAFGLANTIHILHEAEEWYGDKFFDTYNVSGVDDTVDDLMVGILGGLVGLALHYFFVERRRQAAAPNATADDRATPSADRAWARV